jgi:hypothetical protein
VAGIGSGTLPSPALQRRIDGAARYQTGIKAGVGASFVT